MLINTAEVITIGDEIMIGQITDTNTQFISQELNKLGIKIVRKSSVGDTKEEIANIITEAFGRADLVITTGGLGPTKDDITKHTLSDYFKSKLVLHEPTLQHIMDLLEKRGRTLTKTNRMQAYVPDVCEVIENLNGTAPAMWITHGAKHLVSLPGVPYEMKALILGGVKEKLTKHLPTSNFYHKTILTAGIGESMLSDLIEDWELNLPKHIKLAYLPTYGAVRLRLSASGVDLNTIGKEVQQQFDSVLPTLKAYVVSTDYDTFEEALAEKLKTYNLSFATAESCTGGGIASQIVSLPGSSQYFKGGIVAYSNEIKNKVLNVSETTLQKHGAVSEACVREMSQNLVKLMDCNIGVAVSGIAGPSGGSADKPVGTIWMACSDGQNTITKKIVGGKLREANIKLAIQQALYLAWSFLNQREVTNL